MITKITHNWNIKNDYPILDKDQKRREDNIEIYHYCPVARLGVSTAEHYHPIDNQAKHYIVQHEDGWVYNSMFDSCYHWQIATPVTFDEALKMAQVHLAMATYIDTHLEAWILVLDWVEEPMDFDL